jgi:DNA-binding transcriptional LysR family regulator
MRAFVRVAQRGGFAAAAGDLAMSRASVTKHVAALEERLGVRLLDRTTRSVSLTEAGRILLEHSQECLQAFDDCEAAASGLTAEPQGRLRVAAPFDFPQIRALVPRFMRAHPRIELELILSNKTLDMVDEGIDVYVRITNRLDSGLVARRLAVARNGLWGAPSYFRRHGRPRTPADLAEHRFALFNEPPVLDEWVFERRGRRIKQRLPAALTANSGEAFVAAVCDGVALAVLPSFLLPAGHEKLLEPALLDWSLGQRTVFAVYPHRRFVPAKVRVFVDFLRSAVGDSDHDPWWPATLPPPGGAPRR